MDKQFTQAEILLARNAFVEDDTLYVVDDNDKVYGFTKQDKKWFLKEKFWEEFNSNFAMPNLTRINTQLAANLYYEWSVIGTPMEVVHNNYPFTVTFSNDLPEQSFFLNTTEETIAYLDTKAAPELGEYCNFSTNLPLLAAIYFHLVDNFIKQQEAEHIAMLLRKNSSAAITIRNGIAANDEFTIRKGLFQALARKELIAQIQFSPAGTNDPRGDVLNFDPKTCSEDFNAASLKAAYLFTVNIHNSNGEPITHFPNVPVCTYAYYCEMLLGKENKTMFYGNKFTNAIFSRLAGATLSHILRCHANAKESNETAETILEKIVATLIKEEAIEEYEKDEYLVNCCTQAVLERLYDKLTDFAMISISIDGEAPNDPANAIDFNPPTSFA